MSFLSNFLTPGDNRGDEERQPRMKLSKASAYTLFFVIGLGLLCAVIVNFPSTGGTEEQKANRKAIMAAFETWSAEFQPGVNYKSVKCTKAETVKGIGTQCDPTYYWHGCRQIMLNEVAEAINSSDKFVKFVHEEKTKEFKKKYEGRPLDVLDSIHMAVDREYLDLLAEYAKDGRQACAETITEARVQAAAYMADIESRDGYSITFETVEKEEGGKVGYTYAFISPDKNFQLFLERKDARVKGADDDKSKE